MPSLARVILFRSSSTVEKELERIESLRIFVAKIIAFFLCLLALQTAFDLFSSVNNLKYAITEFHRYYGILYRVPYSHFVPIPSHLGTSSFISVPAHMTTRPVCRRDRQQMGRPICEHFVPSANILSRLQTGPSADRKSHLRTFCPICRSRRQIGHPTCEHLSCLQIGQNVARWDGPSLNMLSRLQIGQKCIQTGLCSQTGWNISIETFSNKATFSCVVFVWPEHTANSEILWLFCLTFQQADIILPRRVWGNISRGEDCSHPGTSSVLIGAFFTINSLWRRNLMLKNGSIVHHNAMGQGVHLFSLCQKNVGMDRRKAFGINSKKNFVGLYYISHDLDLPSCFLVHTLEC